MAVTGNGVTEMRELTNVEYEQLRAAVVSVQDRFAALLTGDAEPDRSVARLHVAGTIQVAVASDVEAIIRELAIPIRSRDRGSPGGRT